MSEPEAVLREGPAVTVPVVLHGRRSARPGMNGSLEVRLDMPCPPREGDTVILNGAVAYRAATVQWHVRAPEDDAWWDDAEDYRRHGSVASADVLLVPWAASQGDADGGTLRESVLAIVREAGPGGITADDVAGRLAESGVTGENARLDIAAMLREEARKNNVTAHRLTSAGVLWRQVVPQPGGDAPRGAW